MNDRIIISAIVLCGLLPAMIVPPIAAQTDAPAARYHERGVPDIINISTTNFGMDASNWDIVRDRRGILYVGNTDGVLAYDGETWRLTASPNYTPAFSLDIGADGRVYVGVHQGFGRIEQNADGRDTIILFSETLPADKRPGGQVFETHAIGDRVYFADESSLFEWDGKKVHRLFSDIGHLRVRSADDRLFVQTAERGLLELQHGRLQPVPGAGFFKDKEERISCILPVDGGRLFFATRKAGFLFYQDGMFVPAWSPDISARLPRDLTRGALLSDGTFALGTVSHGLWIVDKNGTVVSVLDASSGLRDEYVVNLYQDGADILWAALDRGLVQIAWPSSITLFGRQAGLKGRVTAITRWRNSVHVATTQGVFRLDPGVPGATNGEEYGARLVQQRNLPAGTLDLLGLEDRLLVAASSGLYVFDGRQIVRISDVSSRHFFPLDSSSGTRFLVAFDLGLGLLTRDGDTWSVRMIFPEISDMIISCVRQPDDVMYFGTYGSGLYAVHLKDDIDRSIIRHIEVTPGEGEYPVIISDVAGRLRVITDFRNWILDPSEGTLFPDTLSRKDFGYGTSFRLSGASQLHGKGYELELMNHRRRRAIAMPEADGTIRTTVLPVLTSEVVHAVFPESDGVVWFGSEDYLFRLELDSFKPRVVSLPTLIRSVYRSDSVVYYWGNEPARKQDLTIPYGAAGVYVRFIVPSLMYPGLTEYRWRLVGLDDAWSEWSVKTIAEFPALSEGRYTFEAQGRLIDGTVCETAVIRIRVTPPMHRTWWAYGLYFLGASGLFVIALRVRTRRLEQRGRELEATIHERTVEIQEQSEKIRSQAEELETLDSIVRTVNKEVRLTDVLSALLQQTLLLFPDVSTAFYMQRSADDGLFRLVASVGEPTGHLASRAFTLSEIMDDRSNSLQSIQDGVYVLRGVERAWNEQGDGIGGAAKSFMGMSDVQHGVIRGFLVLGSDHMHAFDANDLRKLLRLREHVSSAVAKALAIRELESKNEQLDQSNRQLREMQQQLIVHEKLAALGELTAGIAHEIQNPLNFVNNFSSLSLELLDELEEDMTAMQREEDAPILGLVSTVRSNCERIREHGMRATSIVRAMLMHTRKGSGRRETVSLNEFLDQFVLLSYHGMRMLHPEHDLRLHTEYDRGIVAVHILPQEMSRVIVNICNNAWEAAIERAARDGAGDPEVHVRSEANGDRVRIIVRDNGDGIPEEMHGRIFEPFFTTKRSGNNAGLGLSMSYEIVTQLHQGTLGVRSEVGAFSEFVIDLPKNEVLPSA